MEIWQPGSQVGFIRQIRGGHSGATVYLVDIKPPNDIEANGSIDSISGEFILKLQALPKWAHQPIEENNGEQYQYEHQCHLRICEQAGDFATKHVPELLQTHVCGEHTCLLYRVAGCSLNVLHPFHILDVETAQDVGKSLSQALLSDMNSTISIEQDSSPFATLQDWLGYRLDPNSPYASRLRGIGDGLSGKDKLFRYKDEVLVNPLWLCKNEKLLRTGRPNRFVGLLHNDLHAGNILFVRGDRTSGRYWLIDLAYAGEGPLFYDHAYLEFDMIRRHIDGNGHRILSMLDALEQPSESSGAKRVKPNDIGMAQVVRAMREGITLWCLGHQKDRQGVVEAQISLARIAAGLNWANKPLSENTPQIAFAYAGWAARHYLRLEHPDEWQSLLDSNPSPAINVSNEDDSSHWDAAWEAMSRFDSSKSRYLLITGTRNPSDMLASLGMLPWSVVLDFDQNSDQTGLHAYAGSHLSRLRSVRQFGRTKLDVNFDRGTAWIMGGGWVGNSEDAPKDLREWRRQYLPVLRETMEALRHAVSPDDIKVLIMPGPGLAGPILERLLETIDEIFKDSAEFFTVGISDFESDLIQKRFSITPEAFIQRVVRLYGTDTSAEPPCLPGSSEIGADIFVPIETERLRYIEEDLEVLHSAILAQEKMNDTIDDPFWKGNPPTWSDLHNGFDIIRHIHDELVDELAQRLSEHRCYTVELWHHPGAGGTTAALRAAWMLREKHPVVILRHLTANTATRLRELWSVVKRPILLVADGVALTGASLNHLYQQLRIENTWTVILHVVRSDNPNPQARFKLSDPMDRIHAEGFCKLYNGFTDDLGKHKELARITSGADRDAARLRTPFYYGLITFEDEFISLDRYVHAKIGDADFDIKKLLIYLAIITYYTQYEMSIFTAKRVLQLPSDAPISLPEQMGAGPSSLIVHRGRSLAITHHLLAKQILKELLGLEWQNKLASHVLDIIDTMYTCMGGKYSEQLQTMFYQLFIDRQTGQQAEQNSDIGGDRSFAPIVEALADAKQHQVLERLTELCPQESHYWNHLGRHHIYVMKDSFTKAEECLQTAVNLAETDTRHHHSLGMVRRFWIGKKLEQLQSGTPSATPDEILDAVDGLAKQALGSFETVRKLDEISPHGYVTPIQLIAKIAEVLARQTGNTTIYHLTKKGDRVGKWVREHFVIAQDLLSKLEILLGSSAAKNNRHVRQCQSKLATLCGDCEQLIKTWRSLLGSNSGPELGLRRAIASLYYEKNKRHYYDMDVEDCRNMTQLLHDSLRLNPGNSRDIRHWFLAYSQLPEFSFVDALARLQEWTRQPNNLEAHYYLYILHAIRLWKKMEFSEELMLSEMVRCQELSRGLPNRHHSYDWLGKEDRHLPLVNRNELGDQRGGISEKGFFSGADRSLARLKARINTIRDANVGTISLGRKSVAFFNPRGRFYRGADENRPVSFYLGFTLNGFRAYEVTTLTDLSEGLPFAVNQPAASLTTSTDTNGENLYAEATQKVRSVCMDYNSQGKKLEIATLGSGLAKDTLRSSIHKRLGFETLSAFLQSIPDVKLIKEGSRTWVHMLNTSSEPVEVSTDSPSRDGILDSHERVQGEVSKYSNKLRYGFIQCSDGENAFVHKGSIVKNTGIDILKAGDKVEFNRRMGAKGYIAENVVRLDHGL